MIQISCTPKKTLLTIVTTCSPSPASIILLHKYGFICQLSNHSVATHPSIKNIHPLNPTVLLVQYSRQYSRQTDPPATPSADQNIFAVLDENGCPFWRGVDGGDDIATGLGWEGWPAPCEARCGHYRASWRNMKTSCWGGGKGDG